MFLKGLVLVVAGTLAIAYLIACLPKLRRPRAFILLVLDYRILPFALARAYAVALPPLEMVLAILLASGVFIRPAMLVSAAVLTSFIVGLVVNLWRGRDLDCGCFGAYRSRRIGWPLVCQDALLLVASVVGASVARPQSLAWWSPLGLVGESRLRSVLVLTVATACLFIVLVAANAIRVGRPFVAFTRRSTHHSMIS